MPLPVTLDEMSNCPLLSVENAESQVISIEANYIILIDVIRNTDIREGGRFVPFL
jgi:hypothetical protein